MQQYFVTVEATVYTEIDVEAEDQESAQSVAASRATEELEGLSYQVNHISITGVV